MKKSNVVILAGGFGSRLAPVIGNKIPKPMAKIAGIPLLEHHVNLCKKNGFTNILILVHHLHEVIIDYFGDGESFDVNISYHKEVEPRGTAGAILDAMPMLEDDFIVIYGDTYLDVNLSKFFKSKPQKASLVSFCHPNSHPFDSDLLDIDEDNNIRSVFRPSRTGEKTYKNIVNAGLYVASSDLFKKYVPSDGFMDISSELFPIAIKNNEILKAYKSVEYIKDMGTPKRYEEVSSAVSSNIPSKLSYGSSRKCVFLDRDGVINEEVGHLSNVNDFKILKGVSESIALLNKLGYLTICVTNQPVIARGDLTFEGLEEIHMKMEAELGKSGAYLDGIYFCPHHPDKGFTGEIASLKIDCDCRKPKPGLILKASEDFNINLANSWMIGDHGRDIKAGKSAGVKTIYLKKNGSKSSHEKPEPDFFVDSIRDAIKIITTSDNK